MDTSTLNSTCGGGGAESLSHDLHGEVEERVEFKSNESVVSYFEKCDTENRRRKKDMSNAQREG
ncbi:hypothetical protein BgiMline_013672, partial [Biomphalaria glabrata]